MKQESDRNRDSNNGVAGGLDVLAQFRGFFELANMSYSQLDFWGSLQDGR